MFNKVIITFTTRVLTALLSVVNVLIGTNYLGVEGYGTVSLIILGITIYLMIQNLLTGSSIVFFISKIHTSSIALMSYAWAAISILIFISIVFVFKYLGELFSWSFEIVPSKYIWHNILLASGYGLMNIHLSMLLGRERIKAYNLIFLLQHLMATIMLTLYFVILGKDDIMYYLVALYISYFIAFLTAFIFTYSYLKNFQLPKWTEFKAMLRYGVLGQTANVFQLLNYRLSYYLIDIFIGRASLGIFSAATQISEGLWILGKSIATVQFARISNSVDFEYAKSMSIQLLKFTIVITSLPLIVFIFMPISWYTSFLGAEFSEVRSVIRWLSLGTLSLTASMLLSHYFSGIGKIVKNTIGSGIGVISTIIFGFSLIPFFGIKAAALVNSISYLTSFIYLITQFNKERKLKIKDFLVKP